MSYSFQPDLGYRMPTHFGPSTGPRQKPGGGPFALDTTTESVALSATFEADAEQIAGILPAGFDPAVEPDLTVEIKNMTDIGWLAGRGYSVVTVTTGVTWVGGEAPTAGRFKLVLWENAADPIITGREELGYPKLFADIPDVVIAEDSTFGSASAAWGGFRFVSLELTDLIPASIGDGRPPVGPPSFHLKYIPRTDRLGESDVTSTIMTVPGQGPLELIERRTGMGAARFEHATWQQLPTIANVVNGLADLQLGRCRNAVLLRTRGATDLHGQIAVD